MKFIAEQLKAARERNNLSLDELVALTRINRRYLSALEEGAVDGIPIPNLRLMLRSYAKAVGLDEKAILREFDTGKQELVSTTAEEYSVSPADEVAKVMEEVNGADSLAERQKRSRRQDILKISALLFVLMGVIYFVTRYNVADREQKANETPFEEVSQENERIAARRDSLRLEAVALDSVWIMVKIDRAEITKKTLAKGEKASWSAKERFVITASDAGKFTVTLNNRFIGSLGKEGTILRNTILDKKTRFTGETKEEKEADAGQ